MGHLASEKSWVTLFLSFPQHLSISDCASFPFKKINILAFNVIPVLVITIFVLGMK